MAPVLGYWAIRGLAQPIRYLLAYVGAEYEDKVYKSAPPPDWGRKAWLKDKFNLGLDFPNLPYYIDGDLKISQSLAILRHLARKNKLDGQNETEKVRIDVGEQQWNDLNTGLTSICYNPDFEKLKPELLAKLPEQLEQLATFLGNNQYVAGNNISYVDFLLYEYLAKLLLFAPELVKQQLVLVSYVDRIENLPNIKAYLASPQFANYRENLNGPMAQWGAAKI